MSSDEPKKIIIDEDWKTQVQAEKEQLQREKEEPQAAAAPPASLDMLISILATEALTALGQLPRPDGQTPQPNPTQAKLFIDLLGVIEEKTQGNLTAEEATGLQQLLHQLRMAFVAIQNRPAPSPSDSGTPDSPTKPE